MGDDPTVLAEREYQRRLAALHATRAELDAVEAALRRLALDRLRGAAGLDQREADLSGRRDQLAEQARVQRAAAQEQREVVNRHRGEIGAEPVALPPDEPDSGPPVDYLQPPFGGSW